MSFIFSVEQFAVQKNSYLPFEDLNQEDEIFPYEDQQEEIAYNLEENLSFEVKALRNKIIIGEECQQIPAMISVKLKDQLGDDQFEQIKQRIGVDLICIIDRSLSMTGEKIKMLKQTLLVLVDFLSEKDRLQLIAFSKTAEKLTPLKKVNDDSKQQFQTVIDSIELSSGTCIGSATKIAFQQLKNRKYKNNVTSVLILSDGQDQAAYHTVQNQLQDLNEVLTIHTFGFGRDNDSQMMASLCNLGNGGFYFIQNIQLLGVFFGDVLGELKSTVCKKLDFDVQCSPNIPFQEIHISKTYTNIWKNLDNKQYKFYVPFVSFGKRKDFVFELEIPQKNQINLDNQAEPQTIVKVDLNFINPFNQKLYQKHATLELTLEINENSKIENMKDNIDVLIQYFRVKASVVVREAMKLCQQYKYSYAEQLISAFLLQIKENEEVKINSKSIINDLEQVINGAKQINFNNYGKKQMSSIISNNEVQYGVNSGFSNIGDQYVENVEQIFSNKFQIEMQNKFLKLTQNH